jgi:hypothetical protein
VPSLSMADVRALLPSYQFTDAQLDVALNIVTGWVTDATGLDSIPDPPAPALWSAVTELWALLAVNPESFYQKSTGPTSRMWPLAPQRDAILRRLRDSYRGAPRGSFPKPPDYPDAATAVPATVGPWDRWTVR